MSDEGATLTLHPAARWSVRRWGLVGLLLLAWWLRLSPLLESPLHPDEALYGYWGRLIGGGRDPWLVSGPVYKPPLLPYAISLVQLALDDSGLAIRLPGLLAGLLAVPLVDALARALYRDGGTGWVAAAVTTLSPLAIVLSGAAFPDALMVTLGLAACVAAARDSPRWAGLLAGLSFATKQTGLVWLPLVLGVALATELTASRRAGWFAASYSVPVALVFAWDARRVALGADSFWSVGVVGYGGLRLAWSHELLYRIRGWSKLLGGMFGSPLVNAFLPAGLGLLVWAGVRRRPATLRAVWDLLFIAFCLTYALVHWLVAFPVWSRYLLPLVPILAILLGRMARETASLWFKGPTLGARWMVSALALVLLLIPPALNASAGRSALAEVRAAYRGIDDVFAFYGQVPEGSVIYHHWLGWHYRYALFDEPVYLAYWPNPAWLARDVQAFGRRNPRYITFPPWESVARVREALRDVGYGLHRVLPAPGDGRSSFTVYQIVPTASR